MVKGYSILFQKSKAGSPVKDLLADYSMVCTSFPFRIYTETKGLVSDDWADEDGEDTFFPDKLPLKAYDLEVGICYTGNPGDAYSDVVSFLDYLTGEDDNGVELKIYNPYTKIGRKGLYLLSVDEDLFHSSDEDIATFKLTFRVTDPKTRIIPSVDGEGNVTGLTQV